MVGWMDQLVERADVAGDYALSTSLCRRRRRAMRPGPILVDVSVSASPRYDPRRVFLSVHT